MNSKTIILAGNPNVGKSSIFNNLTNKHQHTGNWTGKTVEIAEGDFKCNNQNYHIYDLPGTYSLNFHSEEERVAADFIKTTYHDVTIVVCDATCLERNLYLVLQIMQLTPKVIVCINLIDEAQKKQIFINFSKLSKMLQVPVIPMSARKNYGFNELKEAINNYQKPEKAFEKITDIVQKAKEITESTVIYQNQNYDAKERKIDRILTHKFWGLLTMFALFLLIFWLTISAANYPSSLLFKMFNNLTPYLTKFLNILPLPDFLVDLMINGIYKVLSWVVSVMLPPMAIFFPLFTILEDLGYLPRIAFCLDKCFKKCRSCGKQALTMCMGFGCNAVGVTTTRIIDSKRERLIAILTNSFVPCNGRFPTLISLLSIFIIGLNASSLLSALGLTVIIVFAILITLLISYILSKTILKGEKSAFTIELPPYRSPNLKNILTHSFRDRIYKILKRAISCSVPAGIIIWLLLNISLDNIPVINYLVNLLNPLGNLIGLDGAIILAFILGLPANEIIMPIILMIYLASSNLIEVNELSALKDILINNGWTILTCINFIILSLFHYPCATTILTIKKETNSTKWTLISIIIPLIIGISLCLLIKLLFNIF